METNVMAQAQRIPFTFLTQVLYRAISLSVLLMLTQHHRKTTSPYPGGKSVCVLLAHRARVSLLLATTFQWEKIISKARSSLGLLIYGRLATVLGATI